MVGLDDTIRNISSAIGRWFGSPLYDATTLYGPAEPRVKVTLQLLWLLLTGVRVQGFGVVNVTGPGPFMVKVTVPVGNMGVAEVSVTTASQVIGWPAVIDGEEEVHVTLIVVGFC